MTDQARPTSVIAEEPTSLRRAFTLVELLVVVGVVALMAAILFPVFMRTREAARQTTCLSNAHEIGTGLALYAEDHDETTVCEQFNRGAYTWTWAVNPYIANPALWKDPSDADPENAWDGSPSDTTISYAYNSWFLNGVSLAGVKKPAETVQVVDAGAYSRGAKLIPTGGGTLADYLTSQARVRHNGNVVANYLDGHVRAQRRDQLSQTADTEDGADLIGTGNINDVFLLWNRD